MGVQGKDPGSDISTQVEYTQIIRHKRGARGLMAIVVGIGYGDTSSNPGREWLHFT